MDRAKTRQSGWLCALCGVLLVVAGALWAEENEAEGDGNADAGDDVLEIELVEVEDGAESETPGQVSADDDDPLDLEILPIEEPAAPDKKPAKAAGSDVTKDGAGGDLDLDLDIENIDALLDEINTAAKKTEAAKGTPKKATGDKKPVKNEDFDLALDINLLDENIGAGETQPAIATPPAGQTPKVAAEQKLSQEENLVPAFEFDLPDLNIGAEKTKTAPRMTGTPPNWQTPKVAAEQKPSQEENLVPAFEVDLPDLSIGTEKTKPAPRMTGRPPRQAKNRTAARVDQRSTAKTVAPPNQQNLPRAIDAEILPELIPELVPQPEAPPATRAPPGDSTRREEPRWIAPFPDGAPAPADPELQRLDRLVRRAEQIIYAEILEKPGPDSLLGANGTFSITVKALETWKGDHVIGARIVGTGPPSSSGNGLTANGVSHAILFLRQGRVLTAEHGVIPVKPGAVLREARLRVLKTPAMRRLLIDADSDDGGRPPLLLNIPVTLGIWQTAFNEKDLHWVMRCYSRRHPLWTRYRSGAAGQRTLTLQMASFHGRVSVQVQNWRHLTEDQVEVSVSLGLKQNDVTESRTATMVFILEGGEWRILREGF